MSLDDVENTEIDIKAETIEDHENDCDWQNGAKQSLFIDNNGQIELNRKNGFGFRSFDESSNHSLNLNGQSLLDIKNEPMELIERINDINGLLKKRKFSASLLLANVEENGENGIGENAGKTNRKKVVNNYTQSQLQEALDLVNSQNLSILNASKRYGIPRSTLRRYALTVWAAAAPKNRGKQEPALSPPEEAHIVSMISKMSRAGKYVSTMDVKSTVQNLLDEGKRVVFKDRNRPTAGWVQRFRKRYQHLPLKGSGYTVKKATPQSREDVNEWYKEISGYLLTDWNINPTDIFSDDNINRVFNLDEITILLNNKGDLIEEKVVGSPHKVEELMSEVTVLTAVSATGEFMQPLILQKGEGGGHDDDIMPLDQTSYGISFSISGKLNAEIFIRWLEAFDRELIEKGTQKPIVIFLDDVFAHFHISVFSFALDNDIILLCLQSPTFQPIDAEISERLKEAYRILSKEQYRIEHQAISMDSFPETFLRAWEIVKEEEGVKERMESSFAYFGLLPFSADAMAYTDLPLCSEESIKFAYKAESRSTCQMPKEPKAKKTAVVNPKPIPANGNCAPDLNNLLTPTVKIKKLETQVKSEVYKVSEYIPKNSKRKKADAIVITDVASLQQDKISPELDFSNKAGSSVPKTSSLSRKRLLGRQDGINKCLDLMESFIPSDIIGVWKNRTDDIKSSSEIPYCMWKTVSKIMLSVSTQLKRKGKDSTNKLAKKKKVSLEDLNFINPLDYLSQEPYEM